MGKIFVIMGKTSSGKDTISEHLLEHWIPKKTGQEKLKTVVTYTTRPMRPNETEGVQYFFVTQERLSELREQGKVIEERCYHTVHGPWFYFTVDDDQIDLENHNYLMTNTLAGYEMIDSYYSKGLSEENKDTLLSKKCQEEQKNKIVVPIYIEADSKDRLLRYIHRESLQETPNYSEVCRRFLADEVDFAEEELQRLGITKRYYNRELETCCQEIEEDIEKWLSEETESIQPSPGLERG